MMNQLRDALLLIRRFFEKHHTVLFISFIAILLMLCIYFLYSTVIQNPMTSEETTSTISQFDQKTIEKIKNLHDSSDASQTLQYPTGRINPFVE